jgi:hypothetical protein
MLSENRMPLPAAVSQLPTVREVAKNHPLVMEDINVVVTIEQVMIAIAIAIEDVHDVVIIPADICLSRTRRQAPAC